MSSFDDPLTDRAFRLRIMAVDPVEVGVEVSLSLLSAHASSSDDDDEDDLRLR